MSTIPLNLGSGVTYQTPDTHGYPGGGGVAFSKDLGQLESRSVSVKGLKDTLLTLVFLEKITKYTKNASFAPPPLDGKLRNGKLRNQVIYYRRILSVFKFHLILP